MLLVYLTQIVQGTDAPTLTALDCYSAYTSIEFSRPARTFTVHLVSTNNSACNVFPTGVALNLTIGSSVFPQVITSLYNDFSYANTTDLQVMIPASINFAAFTDEQFVYAVLFSYSEQTSIEIRIFDETKSVMENCLSNASLRVWDTQLSLTFAPQKDCLSLFVADATQPVYISKAQITMNTVIVSMNVTDLAAKYQTAAANMTIIPPSASQINALRTSNYFEVTIRVDFMQGGYAFPQYYAVKSVDVDSITNLNLYTYSEVEFQNNSLVTRFTMNLNIADSVIGALGTYDQIIYRTTLVSSQHEVVSIQDLHQDGFDKFLKQFVIHCDNPNDMVARACKRFYYLGKSDPGMTLYFDLMVMNKGSLLFIKKMVMFYPGDCWKSVTADVNMRKKQFCIDQELSLDGWQCQAWLKQFQGKKVLILMALQNITLREARVVFFGKTYDNFQLYRTRECFAFSDCLNSTQMCTDAFLPKNRPAEGKQMMVMGLNNGTPTPKAIALRIVYSDYSTTMIVTFVFGGLFLGLSAFFTLHGIVKVNQQIKLFREKKREQ